MYRDLSRPAAHDDSVNDALPSFAMAARHAPASNDLTHCLPILFVDYFYRHARFVMLWEDRAITLALQSRRACGRRQTSRFRPGCRGAAERHLAMPGPASIPPASRRYASATALLLLNDDVNKLPESWSPDGRFLLYYTQKNFWVVAVVWSTQAVPVPRVTCRPMGCQIFS